MSDAMDRVIALARRACANAEDAAAIAMAQDEVNMLRDGLYPLSQHTVESARSLAEDIGASEDSLFASWIREKATVERVRALRARLPETGWVGPWVHVLNIRDALDEALDGEKA